MRTDLQIKNQKSISYWVANFADSNDFDGSYVGRTINVSTSDVFPNLRAFGNDSGCEFEIQEGEVSFSSEPIEVSVCTKTGKLIIEDGHHRLNDAINAGLKRVDVFVSSERSACTILLFKCGIIL